MLAACPGDHLMLGCKANINSNVMIAAAEAPRADVLFDVGQANDGRHNANGTDWYYSPEYSWGFAPEGVGVSRNSCDTNNVRPEERLCWHTRNQSMNGGWRCGSRTGLNGDRTFVRTLWQPEGAGGDGDGGGLDGGDGP